MFPFKLLKQIKLLMKLLYPRVTGLETKFCDIWSPANVTSELECYAREFFLHKHFFQL
jgi:hypothetical protein